MRPQHRQFLSYVLLATYASISLLGDGLHMLLPEGDHHHHGIQVVSHRCHDGQHADEHHDHDCCDCSKDSVPALSDSNADSHVCEICSFIVFAVSQPAEVAAPLESQRLIVVVPAHPRAIFSLVFLGPQAPRGPPLFLA